MSSDPAASCDAACRGLLALALLALLLAWASPAIFASELTPQEKRGKVVYFEGTNAAGDDITALMGAEAIEVPASVIPCGGCHGADGRGRPEGGISPSNLTWPELTKPYGATHPSGRQHPPYSERLLVRAITMGLDPAGNRLHLAMPRYQLTRRDADDLTAYIRRLGSDLDPGLDADSITVATLVPKEGPAASLGEAIEAVLAAYFEQVNRAGGVYGRRLELRAVGAPDGAGERAAALRAELETGEIFAVVGAFLAAAEEEVTDLVEALETPLIGPFTQQPILGFPVNRFVFYLLPGLEDLGRALVSFAAADAEATAAVVTGSEPRFAAAAREVVARAAELGWPQPRIVEARAADLEALERSGIDRVFLFAAGDEQAAFLRSAAARAWHPQILLPGTLLRPGIFESAPGFDGRIVLAFPTLPSNQTAEGAAGYRRLAAEHALPARHLTAQIASLASARVLVEGLKRAGRELSRERLIEALESFSEVDTGLTPLVTYGPNRRVGVEGAYMIALDLEAREMVPASGWVRSR